MDQTELTPQNAPRDLAALAACSPYQLRRLAETHLAGLRNEQEKMAWFGLKTPESKATYILELLKRWDQQNPGAHTNGVAAPAQAAPALTRDPVTSAPVQAPAVQSLAPAIPQANSAPAVAVPGFIPAVAPGAVAAANAAAAEKPKTTRAPKTTAAPGDLGADVVNLLNLIRDGQEKALKGYEDMTRTVTNILEEASSLKNSRVETLEGNYLVLQKQVETLTGMLQNMMQVQIWTLMAIATSNPNASPLDVLRSAIGDSESFSGLVAQARGKA